MTERVLVFGKGSALIGVVTEPAEAGASDDLPAVVFLNSGLIHRVGPSRLHVRMAREVAGKGMVAFRFDHSGIGDSRAATDRLSVAERWVAETRAAMDLLEKSMGTRQFVLVGNCSGAASAYFTGQVDERVTGLALINPQAPRTLRFYLRLVARNRASWRRLAAGRAKLPRLPRRRRAAGRADNGEVRPRSPSLMDGLSSLVARDVDLLLACSEWDPGYDFFLRKHRRRLLVSPAAQRITLEVIEGANHDLGLVANQEQLFGLVERWVSARNETRWR